MSWILNGNCRKHKVELQNKESYNFWDDGKENIFYTGRQNLKILYELKDVFRIIDKRIEKEINLEEYQNIINDLLRCNFIKENGKRCLNMSLNANSNCKRHSNKKYYKSIKYDLSYIVSDFK
jgi:hypothetical protein